MKYYNNSNNPDKDEKKSFKDVSRKNASFAISQVVRVLDMAERILNLQKSIVDSTISTAAGLEKGSSYSVTTYQALPYFEYPSHLPTYLRQNSNALTKFQPITKFHEGDRLVSTLTSKSFFNDV